MATPALPSLGTQLGSARAKIARADQHVRDLRQSLRRFGQRDHYDIAVQQFTPAVRLPATVTGAGTVVHHLAVSIQLTPRPEVAAYELRWGTVVGDVVHNLASALDNLVFELGEANRANWPANWQAAQRYAGFPYTKARMRGTTDLWQSNVNRYLQLVDPGLYGVFEQAQPFFAGQGQGANPAQHPLWILHELWNDDKHQTVNVTGTGSTFNFTNIRIPNLFPGATNLPSTTIASFPMRPIRGQTEIARIVVTLPAPLAIGATPVVYVRPNLSLAILFGPGTPAPNRNVLDCLMEARDAVVNFVEQFA